LIFNGWIPPSVEVKNVAHTNVITNEIYSSSRSIKIEFRRHKEWKNSLKKRKTLYLSLVRVGGGDGS
jgi:hypothetical protein